MSFLAARYPVALRSFAADYTALKSMLEPWINTFKSDIDLDPYPSGGACFAFACMAKVRHHYRYEMTEKTIGHGSRSAEVSER